MMNDDSLGNLYETSILDVARGWLEEEERLLGNSVLQLSSVSLVVPEGEKESEEESQKEVRSGGEEGREEGGRGRAGPSLSSSSAVSKKLK